MSLALERDALSHSIMKDNREFLLQMRQMNSEEGAEDLEGEDRAGMYTRQDYGLLPDSNL